MQPEDEQRDRAVTPDGTLYREDGESEAAFGRRVDAVRRRARDEQHDHQEVKRDPLAGLREVFGGND